MHFALGYVAALMFLFVGIHRGELVAGVITAIAVTAWTAYCQANRLR
jgi:hypothetical protein